MPIAICPAPNGITPAATKPEYHVVTGRSATDSTVVLSLFLLRVRAAVVGPSRHFAATQQTVADEPTADIALPSESRIYQPGVGTTPSFFCRLDDDVVY
jgi:hypothetical protein